MIFPSNTEDKFVLSRFLLDIFNKFVRAGKIKELSATASNEEIIDKINEIIRALK